MGAQPEERIVIGPERLVGEAIDESPDLIRST